MYSHERNAGRLPFIETSKHTRLFTERCPQTFRAEAIILVPARGQCFAHSAPKQSLYQNVKKTLVL